MLERHKSKVQAFEMRCLRRVEGVTILAGQSEECGHQIEIGTGVSSIESGEEKDRVVEENGRNVR